MWSKKQPIQVLFDVIIIIVTIFWRFRSSRQRKIVATADHRLLKKYLMQGKCVNLPTRKLFYIISWAWSTTENWMLKYIREASLLSYLVTHQIGFQILQCSCGVCWSFRGILDLRCMFFWVFLLRALLPTWNQGQDLQRDPGYALWKVICIKQVFVKKGPTFR